MKTQQCKFRSTFNILILLIVFSAFFTKSVAQTGTSMQSAIDAGTLNVAGNSAFVDGKFTSAGNIFVNNYGQPSPNIWYKFTISTPLQVSISTCSLSSIDTYLHVLYNDGSPYLTNNDNGPLCTGTKASIKQVFPAGTYYIVSEGNGSATGRITTGIVVAAPEAPAVAQGVSLSTSQNYLMETIVRAFGQNTQTQIGSLSTDSAIRTVRYLDGLGRPVQVLQVMGNGTSTKDLVTPVVYDGFGREVTSPLVYSATGPSGSFRATSAADQASFYTSGTVEGVVRSTMPWAQKFLEFSPLSRPIEIGGAGTDWQPAMHTTHVNYALNDNVAFNPGDNKGSRQVAFYNAPVNADGSRTLSRLNNNATYANQDLTVTITKDENWTVSDGCKGTTEEYKDKEGNVVLKRTYNAKDGQIEMLSTYYVFDDFGNLCFVLPPGANPDQGTVSQTALDDFCYQYRYDAKKRTTEKKIPGKGWEYMVYNKIDQVVLSQDANLRISGQWLYNKYDGVGRPVITGIYNNSLGRAVLQGVLDQETALWESRNVNADYSNLAFPQSGTDMQTISYYDDYSFPDGSVYTYPAGSNMTRGLQTGSKVKVLGTQTMLLSLIFYDDEGRSKKLFKQHYLSGAQNVANYDETTNVYFFSGELKTSTRIHHAGANATNIALRYDYDHMGRKLLAAESINGAAEVRLNKLEYNEIGQVLKKSLHSTDGINFLQHTDYSYNERGWLKMSKSDPFSFELKYQDSSIPQYNGNISGQNWGAGESFPNSFTYRYDDLNRLLSGVSTGVAMSEVLSYDLMGNIKTMNRDAAGVGTYAYSNGNRLDNITGGGIAAGTYSYDFNGNVIVDGRTGAALTYNSLNLPAGVTGNGVSITYVYDASGNKLRKVSGGVTRDYIDGIEYNGNVIDIIHTEEGIARNSGGLYRYEYNLTDHLGNVRCSFYKNPVTGLLEKLQEDNYYPFGLQKLVIAGQNKYLYNGKELQEELGQLDYGARFYDPVIGRWNVIDPLAEQGRRWTPYAYAFDNPIYFIDPDGMWPDPPGFLSGAGSFLIGIGNSALSTVTGVVNTIIHPVETVKGISSLNSPEGAVNMAIATSQTINKFQNGNSDIKAEMIGQVVGDIGQMFIGTGELKIASEASKVVKGVDEAVQVVKTTSKESSIFGKNPFIPVEEGTTVKTVKTAAGNTKIDASGRGVAHTQLREDATGNYAQRTTFDAKGRKRSDTHFTTHGEVGKSSPHKHTYYKNGKRSGGN